MASCPSQGRHLVWRSRKGAMAAWSSREADEAGRRGGGHRRGCGRRKGGRRGGAAWGKLGAAACGSSVGKMGAAAWGRVSRNGRRGEAAPGVVEKKLFWRLGEVGVPCGVVWGDRVFFFFFPSSTACSHFF